MKKILISGATGLVGKKLSQKLYERGYNVELLVRSKKEKTHFKSYLWDYKNNFSKKMRCNKLIFLFILLVHPLAKDGQIPIKKRSMPAG